MLQNWFFTLYQSYEISVIRHSEADLSKRNFNWIAFRSKFNSIFTLLTYFVTDFFFLSFFKKNRKSNIHGQKRINATTVKMFQCKIILYLLYIHDLQQHSFIHSFNIFFSRIHTKLEWASENKFPVTCSVI